jgi:hypothetical protein
VKSVKALLLSLIILVATPAFSKPPEADILAAGEGNLSIYKKTKGDPMHGFTLGFGFNSSHRMNVEPDNAEWITSYAINAGWKLGQVLAPKTWFKNLGLSAAFNFSNEIVGNSSKYRSGFYSDPNFFSKDLSYLGIGDSVLTSSESADIDRRVDGSEKRIDYSDIVVTLAHGKMGTIPGLGVGVRGSISGTIPLSLASTNAGLLTKFDYSVGLSKTFKFNKMSLSLSYGLTLSHYIYDYATKGISSIDQDIYVNDQPIDSYDYNSGTRNNEYAFTNMVSFAFSPMKKLTIMGTYGLLTMRTYNFTNCDYTTPDGTVIDLCQTTTDVRGYDDGGRGRRDYQMFSLGVSYGVLDYLTLSMMLSTFTPQLKATTDEYQQPFISLDRNNYSSLMFKVSYSFNSFYKKVLAK